MRRGMRRSVLRAGGCLGVWLPRLGARLGAGTAVQPASLDESL